MKKVAPQLDADITVTLTISELALFYAALGSASNHALARHIADAPVFADAERNQALVQSAIESEALYDEVKTLLKSEGIDVL